MAKRKYWEYICDHCGMAEHFTYVNDAFDNYGWKQYRQYHFCSERCLDKWTIAQI